ncbi:protein of unknown function DUF343 [Syntrophobotulus glycolicus DSM 8271]|uniref:Uncharacterized protein n=1 Tax=Syntrophobotulus glycolicus (strain DSM 8271 / FlGlyR) TaxID=645991 RepID=F0SVS7_SYNGF|nr:Trm112 family protein [Syntrophobotulus glycolicus]ADY55633.1 protein of unknown function DUF343 [Syntrophobotulus glycolicus DSM 8271]
MAVNALLLNILVDPVDKGELLWKEGQDYLYNPRTRQAYPIQNGIPELLADKAKKLDV